LAASIARRTAETSLTTPVEVSLWTMHTALMAWPVSPFSLFSIAAGSAGLRQSPPMNSDLMPSLSAIFFHSEAKWPVSHISTRSPEESVFTSAASHAPVPDAG
jgi:hypothetical protein